jgi:hypothetical protein
MNRLLPALVCALMLSAVGPSAAPAAPVLGVNVSGIPSDQQLDEAVAVGAREVRMFLLWKDVEPRRGALEPGIMRRYAAIIAKLGGAGVRTQFVVTGSPGWASGSQSLNTPPTDPNAYASFLARFAATSGFTGKSIAYELWNEQDDAQWWGPQPNPGAYAALVKAAYPALKRADPSATVVLGPTVGNNYAFIEQLYANGIKGFFDAASVHTDTGCLTSGPGEYYREAGRLGRFSFLGYREVRAAMLANGDDKPLRMTEFGWSSTQLGGRTPRCERGVWAGRKPSGVTEDRQASLLQEAYHCMAGDAYIQSASWFTMRDATPAESQLDELRHYGLLRTDGSQKPAWQAFKDVATKGDQRTGQCGDFSGPALRIVSPRPGQEYGGTLVIRASAQDAAGVKKIAIAANGRTLRNFEGPVASGRQVLLRWQRAKQLPPGPITIQVSAVDARGNLQQQSVEVRKVVSKAKAKAKVRKKAGKTRKKKRASRKTRRR